LTIYLTKLYTATSSWTSCRCSFYVPWFLYTWM